MRRSDLYERRPREDSYERRRRRSPSSSSSCATSELYEGFMSDSDDGNEGAVEWMRTYGRRASDRRRVVIRGDTVLEAVKLAIRSNVRGKYGTFDQYLRFLHRHSRRCRPPPGRAPEQQTTYLLRNFLRTLHDDDRNDDLDGLIRDTRHAC